MEKAPDFLKNANESITAQDMSDLDALITEYDKVVEEVARAEKIFNLAKKRFNELALDRIPEFLLSHGIKEMKLIDGRKVTVSEDISVTVKDERAFREWLKERNEMDIVKVRYAFARMEDSKIEALSNYLFDHDYDFEIDENIHGQTKKKYFKELIAEIGRHKLPEWVSIYDIRKAVIKNK